MMSILCPPEPCPPRAPDSTTPVAPGVPSASVPEAPTLPSPEPVLVTAAPAPTRIILAAPNPRMIETSMAPASFFCQKMMFFDAVMEDFFVEDYLFRFVSNTPADMDNWTVFYDDSVGLWTLYDGSFQFDLSADGVMADFYTGDYLYRFVSNTQSVIDDWDLVETVRFNPTGTTPAVMENFTPGTYLYRFVSNTPAVIGSWTLEFNIDPVT